MRKLIAAINITLDGSCDHRHGIPDEEIHMHYTEMLRGAGAVLYGRVTYQLMEFWRTLIKEPSGNAVMDEFAEVMDNAPKIVFSHTLKELDWHSARLATRDFKEEVLALKAEEGKDIYVGSPGLISLATDLGLVDEFQICVHPVIAGEGMRLFKNQHEQTLLTLTKTKTFTGGAIILYYEPKKG